MCKKLYERGFHEKDLNKIMKQREDIDRNQLLQDRTKENKDPQVHCGSNISTTVQYQSVHVIVNLTLYHLFCKATSI